jgi:short subunit dehydrogenase-like uncharacterized protein
MSKPSEFDLVVFGATGFTGGLVAEHLARTQENNEGLRWALAGRSLQRLEDARRSAGAADDLALIQVNATDPASVQAMVERTTAVITTAGPYQLFGSELVAACARNGTDYLDLTGEPIWMRQMIDAHEAQAQASGARILFSCGIDSIPSELGVWFCQQVAEERLGAYVPRVKGRFRAFVGGMSGGSLATRDAIMAAVAAEPRLVDQMADPFLLTPGFRGPEQPPANEPTVDPDVGDVGPFMLAGTNSMNVHRSHLLLGHPFGADFRYDEMMVIAPGSTVSDPVEPDPDQLPKPGEGPSRDVRLAGSFDLLLIGVAADGRQVRVSVKGDQDPGYGSTSQMISETALCLLADDHTPGGTWTPAAALQRGLLDRLQDHAGLTFTDETEPWNAG